MSVSGPAQTCQARRSGDHVNIKKSPWCGHTQKRTHAASSKMPPLDWPSRPTLGRAVREVRAEKAVELVLRRAAPRDPILWSGAGVCERRVGAKARSAAGVALGSEARESLQTYQERRRQPPFAAPERPPALQALLLDGCREAPPHHCRILPKGDTGAQT